MTGRPRALSAQMVGRRSADIARGVPTRGAPRGREHVRRALVVEATAGRTSRLSACTGQELWAVWGLCDLVEAGVVRLVLGDDRVTVLRPDGTTSYAYADLTDSPPPTTTGDAPGSLFDLGQQAVDRPAARVTDGATPWAAARSLDPERVGQQCFAALRVIARYGDEGTTVHTVATALGRESGRVARRVTDLVERGLAEPTGDERRVATGRLQRVVRATPAGHRLVARYGGHGGEQEAS